MQAVMILSYSYDIKWALIGASFFFSDLLFPSGDPSLVDGEFLDKFDIVVVSGASLKTKVQILLQN